MLLQGDAVIRDPKTLERVIETYIRVYGEAPWNEGAYCEREGHAKHISLSAFQQEGGSRCQCGATYVPYYTEAELQQRFREDLTSTPNTVPLLAVWRGPSQEVKGFAIAIITSSPDKVNEILLRAPYFGGSHVNPGVELRKFWDKLQLRNSQKFLFAHETGVLPKDRGDPSWYQISSEIVGAAVAEGCQDFIGVTTEKSQFFRLTDRLGLIKIVHTTNPTQGEPLLMIHCNKLSLLDNALRVVSKAQGPLAAARTLVQEIIHHKDSGIK